MFLFIKESTWRLIRKSGVSHEVDWLVGFSGKNWFIGFIKTNKDASQ